jgi:acyl-CoA reductase-like NAD-dependent aldehyde dehydrogenase
VTAEPGAAIRRARTAQKAWARTGLAARAAVIRAAARHLAGDADQLARMIAEAQHRPPDDVWSAEVVPTLDAVRWLARAGVRHLQPRMLARSRLQWYFHATRHELLWEPHGVMGIVSPGNALLFLSVPQVAAALLAGNAVVWKPAPAGAAVALAAASCLRRAGLEPGLVEVVPGGAEASRALIEAGVDKLFFTGGSTAGHALYGLQAARGRPAVLELSGRHVAVVLDGVDPAVAARGIVWGKLSGGGRHCVSVQLVLVEAPAAGALLAGIRRALGELHPTMLEPVRDEAERRRLRDLAADAVARGARLLAGDGTGATLLASVTRGMRVVEEEIQGPILAVATVESSAAAAAWINDSPYRLSASIWCAEPGRARRLACELDVGQVWINEQLHPVAQPEVTLSGRGASGFGASRGWPGLAEMVQPKVISETPLRASRRHYRPAPPGLIDLFRGTVAVAFAPGLVPRARAVARLGRALARLAAGRAPAP